MLHPWVFDVVANVSPIMDAIILTEFVYTIPHWGDIDAENHVEHNLAQRVQRRFRVVP